MCRILLALFVVTSLGLIACQDADDDDQSYEGCGEGSMCDDAEPIECTDVVHGGFNYGDGLLYWITDSEECKTLLDEEICPCPCWTESSEVREYTGANNENCFHYAGFQVCEYLDKNRTGPTDSMTVEEASRICKNFRENVWQGCVERNGQLDPCINVPTVPSTFESNSKNTQ
jgi:hypothetical protein